MTVPEHVNEVLANDPTLNDEQRTALGELFGVAYQQITIDNDGPVELDLETPTRSAS